MPLPPTHVHIPPNINFTKASRKPSNLRYTWSHQIVRSQLTEPIGSLCNCIARAAVSSLANSTKACQKQMCKWDMGSNAPDSVIILSSINYKSTCLKGKWVTNLACGAAIRMSAQENAIPYNLHALEEGSDVCRSAAVQTSTNHHVSVVTSINTSQHFHTMDLKLFQV